MLGHVLLLLKDELNEYVNAHSGWSSTESGQEKVVLLDGENMEPITFKLGAVSAMLVNLEEENAVRPAERYHRSLPDGTKLKVHPEVHLNLYVLFVARFKQYEQGLEHLSLVIRYFQSHRVLDRHNAPGLSDRIEKLTLELVTLPFAEQNEIWNALRTTYHPSVLYKVRLVSFRDDVAIASPEVAEAQLRTVS